MQTVITGILVLAALIIFFKSTFKSTKKISSSNPCGECGSSCEGCMFAKKNEIDRRRMK